MINRRMFLRQLGGGAAGLATMIWLPGCTGSGARQAVAGIHSPESQGVASQGLIDFHEAVNTSDLEFHSIMINRNGKLILEGWWEPFKKEYIHTLYSLSKSFTSTAVGMLYDDGKVKPSDKVISFFPDKLPAKVSDNLAAMSVHDLLTMHTGHTEDTMGKLRVGGDDWVKNFLALEVPAVPGTHFLYNTGATYMLSAIVQKVSGQNLMDFLTPRLFEPLGIVGADWEADPMGINVGGYGLRIRAQDILNFGQLYLQEGEWNGKRILSKEWVSEATRKQVNSQDNDSDWGQGYGYQFWRCKPGCYRGDGAFGQYCIVVPDKNAVIAITSETKDMAASMQLVWDHILPAMKDTPSLPDDAAAADKLRSMSAGLKLAIEGTSVATNRKDQVNGKTYQFAENSYNAQRVSFSFAGDQCEVTFEEDGKAIRFKSGAGAWVTDGEKPGNSLFALRGRTPVRTAISSHYYWSDPDTLVVTAKYVENAHHDVFTFVFSDDGLELRFGNSVSSFRGDADPRAPIRAALVDA
ncbi:MAG TPA: serine hydrolase [Cyclobacteriaceae bacterium]|jgi:hypothetical protein